MRLTDREARILAGEAGEAPSLALEQQIAVGEFFDAEHFVPITNAHMMGDMEVMGDAGFAFVESLVKNGAAFAVPVTTNARCVDFERAAAVRQDPALVAREAALVAHLKKLGALQVDTCINYQTVYQPRFGEHLAWGDTGTVIWANSVTGARTNYEAGPAAVAAGLTGVTPAYGYHLDAQRAGTLRFEVRCALNDYADWGALGGIIGRRTLDYWKVPVLAGVRHAPAGDELKHFGAALASYGSCAMYHMIGVTPEARDEAEAFRGAAPEAAHVVDDAALAAFYRTYPEDRPEIDVVVFSGPQLSVLELRRIAALLDGRRVHANTALLVTTNFANREMAVISRRGHALEGCSLAGKIVYFPAVQGGVAAGWAFLALVHRGVAPAAVIFGRTNPVMIQGLVLAGISAMHRVTPDPFTVLCSGDRVRVSPARGVVEVVR